METLVLHSNTPDIICPFTVPTKEYMQYLYMPIRIKGKPGFHLEKRLEFLRPFIVSCNEYEYYHHSYREMFRKYVYVTIKQTFVPKGIEQNRPGWHSDGFGTDDVNYVFVDKWPTEFLLGDIEVRNDDSLSMIDMNNYADRNPGCIYQPDAGFVYRLDQNHVHRTVPAEKDGVRTFIKITFSDHKYAQEGNTHNYELDYDWSLSPRKEERNQPHLVQ